MYYFSSPSTFNPPIPTPATSPSSPPSAAQFRTPSTARSRRKINIKASLSSVLESIKFNSNKSTSLYEILRVDNSASQTEIKTAYRSLAKLYHPDAVHVDSDESGDRNFIQIHDAYETLSDPSARAMYDLSISNYYRRKRPVGFSGGYYTTRRWETDQCW
ncbi:Chaperone DnaJ-domain superfamily protein [Euphorbia peplus]|nr:Chaperone DnaJ-domain superfamily protein [Euphorbia peplus]